MGTLTQIEGLMLILELGLLNESSGSSGVGVTVVIRSILEVNIEKSIKVSNND